MHPGGSKTARAFWHVGTTAVQNSLQMPYENGGSDYIVEDKHFVIQNVDQKIIKNGQNPAKTNSGDVLNFSFSHRRTDHCARSRAAVSFNSVVLFFS